MGIDATTPIDRPFPEMVDIPGLDKVPDFLAGLKKGVS
jgi:hypothetical protein